MALLLTPDGQVHTVDMDDVPALNQQVQAYRILLSYPTFYKQQQVQMFLWQGADGQVKAAATAPEPGARRLEKPEETNEGLQRLGELATHTRGGIAINDNQEKYAWPNLPGTGKEVDEVAALFPPDTRRVYKKKQASEKVLRNLDQSGELAGYKILLLPPTASLIPRCRNSAPWSYPRWETRRRKTATSPSANGWRITCAAIWYTCPPARPA
jgi:hypothetical protein